MTGAEEESERAITGLLKCRNQTRIRYGCNDRYNSLSLSHEHMDIANAEQSKGQPPKV
jgi:hypothetical protein